MGNDGAAAVEDAGQVHGQDPVPGLGRIVPGLDHRPVDAGVVDQDLDIADGVAGGLEGPLHVFQPGDVHPLDMGRLEVKVGVERRRVSVPDHDPAAIRREAPRDAQPDASGSAGDDRGLAENAWFHVISPAPRARLWNDEPALYGPRQFSGARLGRGRCGLPRAQTRDPDERLLCEDRRPLHVRQDGRRDDVYLFAGITGDLSPNHVNKSYMEKSSYGRLQAHGALLVGYMSTASTLAIAHAREGADETPVSLGYDRIRFLAPVYFGDTITVDYTIAAIDEERRRSPPTSGSRTRTVSWWRWGPTS